MKKLIERETIRNLIEDLKRRVEEKILEPNNFDFILKLLAKAEDETEAINICNLATTYHKTGLVFEKKLEVNTDSLKYFSINDKLSFGSTENPNKLIIGDNYDALLNLLVSHRRKIDVIYIDPPYGSNSLGEYAKTNYENQINRDNLLSMLWPRLVLAKQLLTPDGVIFCSIDDLNQAYIKTLFDEVFGEAKFLLNVPRITKKGGKSTTTISKNNDYIIAYTLSDKLIFSQEEKTEIDLEKYDLEDEFVEKRGKYKLSQTLDYYSLQWSAGMDYVLEFQGKKFVPGGDVKKFEERHKGNHGITDWVWRWSKSAVEWGIKEKLLVLKNNRIYTKSYLNCRKVNSKNELEYIDPTKSFTTLSYLDNQYSNDNGTKELDKIFENSGSIFKNPKPSKLIQTLITMVTDNKNAIILDFFAGSGTTGHAVLELNRLDGGSRKFILCNLNEITTLNPNGIVTDVTSKRIKRIMTGSCYDDFAAFTWLKDNKPYGGSLQVIDLEESSVFDENLISKINENLYGISKFNTLKEKIEWVCENFEKVARKLKNA